MKYALAALALAATFALPVSAATVGTIGPGNDGLDPLGLSNPLEGYFGDNISLSGGPVDIQVTILGSEAGYNNAFTFGSETYSTGGNTNAFADDYLGAGIDSWVVSDVSDGYLDFYFSVNGVATVFNGYNPDGTTSSDANFFTYYVDSDTVLLFLDDAGAGPDDNHDDLIVRLDIVVAPVPVPAAGLLLAGALGGLAALRRRRRAS
jgi:hypothetical protein